MLIADNDCKFHTKMLVDLCKKHGIQIYLVGEKPPWDQQINGYPPRSHDCMPCETEFTNSFKEAQEDVERREKNRGYKRTMKMWKHSIVKIWENRPIESVRKLIIKQPKIMEEIIAFDGARTTY